MHPFSTPWKHQKTVTFSGVFWCFQGVEKKCLGTNGLMAAKTHKYEIERNFLEIKVEKSILKVSLNKKFIIENFIKQEIHEEEI